MTVTRRCKTGKTSYHDLEEAKRAIRGIRIRAEAEGQTEPIPCRAYQCQHCHRVHLTTQEVPGVKSDGR